MLIKEFLLYLQKRGLEILIIIAVVVAFVFAIPRIFESISWTNIPPLVPVLAIIFVFLIVISLVYEFFSYKYYHSIPFKRWNVYLEEARKYRAELGYTSFENIPYFLENKFCSIVVREADIENSLNTIIRLQNKKNKQCYEIYTCRKNIEQLRVLFNIWTILLIYFNNNTTFNDIILWINIIIRNERDIPDAWRIHIKRFK